MNRFLSWLDQRYAPAVLVASNAGADDAAAKNGLGMVDLLRPVGHVSRLNVPIRIGDVVSRVQELQLHFYEARTIYQAEPKAIESHLRTVLNFASEKYAHECPQHNLLQLVERGQALPTSLPEDLTPWLADYREELMRVTVFGDHEALDHPVAAILVTNADCDNPVTSFNLMQNLLVPPPLMKQEVMYPLKDPEFPRFYILLQDASEPQDDEKAAKNLNAARSAFGVEKVVLLRINTGTVSGGLHGTGAPPDAFRSFMRTPLPGGGAGEALLRPSPPPQGLAAFLSADDLSSVAAAMRVFVLQVLLPGLQARILKLDANITATRRGLRNRLTRFWKAPVVGAEDVLNDKPWPWHSIESQLRQLADLAFLFQAYDYAAATYRLGAQDYQAVNNVRWYAGTQEMIALALIMAPTDDSDPLKYFSRAIEQYTKLPGARARLLASRCTLMAGLYQQAAGRHISCSVTLFRAHFGEEDGRAALMLEQSALSQLYLQPASTRRFAFRMVLSGLRYFAAGNNLLGALAYRQAIGAYKGKKWHAIEQHLHDILGNQSLKSGHFSEAAQHFLAPLQDTSARSASTQAHYFAEFLGAVKGLGQQNTQLDEALLLDNLNLPEFNAHDVSVAFSGPSHTGNDEAKTVEEAEWERLEGFLSPSIPSARLHTTPAKGTSDAPSSHPLWQPGEKFNLTAAGEPLIVRVKVHNPSALRLRLTSLRLDCAFEPLDPSQPPLPTEQVQHKVPASAITQQRTAEEAEENEEAERSRKAVALDPLSSDVMNRPLPTSQASGSIHLHIVERRLTLAPNQAHTIVDLCVVPLSPGWLRVRGVAWVVDGAVGGHKEFNLHSKPPSKQQANSSRVVQQRFASHPHLLFGITQPMPHLELCSPPAMPEVMYMGELGRVVLRLRNSGGLPCHNLQLIISHPSVCCSSRGSSVSGPLKDALTDPADVIRPKQMAPAVRAKGASLYRLWQGLSLVPGSTFEWPLWVHPTSEGMLQFQLLWAYQPAQQNVASPMPSEFLMRLRTMRLSFTVPVTPLLGLRPSISPCAKHVTDTLLQLRFEALKEVEATAVVEQVSCMTQGRDAGWRLIMSKRSGPEAAVAVAVAAAAARARTAPPASQPEGLKPQDCSASTQQQLRQSEHGEVCGHTLRPGVLLKPGQATTSTLTLRAPHAPQLLVPLHLGAAAAEGVNGSQGGEGCMSEVSLPLLPVDSLPHQQASGSSHTAQGAHHHSTSSSSSSFQQPQGAGVLPLPHATSCSPYGISSAFTFPLVAPPAVTTDAYKPSAPLTTPILSDPSASANLGFTLEGPLGHWYAPSNTPPPIASPTRTAAKVSSPSFHHQQSSNISLSPLQQQSSVSSGTATCEWPRSSVDPDVDIAVVWRVPARGRIQHDGSSISLSQKGGGGLLGSGSIHGGAFGSGSMHGSIHSCDSGEGLQGSIQQQQDERFGILWMRNVLRKLSTSPPLPLVRATLSVADAKISGPSLTLQSMGSNSGKFGGGECVVVGHDFQRHPMCMVKVLLNVRNSASARASLVVQADNGHDSPGGGRWLLIPPLSAASTMPAASSSFASPQTTLAPPSVPAGTPPPPVRSLMPALPPANPLPAAPQPSLPGKPLGQTSSAHSTQLPAPVPNQQPPVQPQLDEVCLGQSPDFTWCGRTCVNLAVGPGMGASVPLQVAVHRPGHTICLSGISVLYTIGEGPTAQPQQCLEVSKLCLRIEEQ